MDDIQFFCVVFPDRCSLITPLLSPNKQISLSIVLGLPPSYIIIVVRDTELLVPKSEIHINQGRPSRQSTAALPPLGTHRKGRVGTCVLVSDALR